MARNRMKWGLAAALTLLMGAAVSAQGVRDMQLFATMDQSRYGGGIRPAEGYFFVFDGLYWDVSGPDTTDIGMPGLTRNVVNVPVGGFPTPPAFPLPVTVESSSVNTGFIDSKFTGGQRYEAGYVSGHNGWLFSGFTLQDVNHTAYASRSSVVFQDAPLGVPIPALDAQGNPGAITSRLQGWLDAGLTTGDNLPVTFNELTAHNKVDLWGVEWNYLYRMHPNNHGGIFELMVGVRYLEFNEQFHVEGIGGILDESQWFTKADNHIIGPQFGIRWFRQQNRWTWSVTGRYFGGHNAQSINQRAELASNLVPTTPATPGQPVKLTSTIRTESVENAGEWSNNAELRFELKYQLTRSIAARVGWTGLWLNEIARPSNLINYSLRADGSVLGISTQNNTQGVFANGLIVGVEVNR